MKVALQFFTLMLLAACFVPVSAQESDSLTDVDRSVMKELTGVNETPLIVFHYRPEDITEERLAETVKINLARFAECEKLLKMELNGRVHIFLYRDMEDLQKTTGFEVGGFATGTHSIHQPLDFDSVHELVHIFSLQFPSDEDEVTELFFVEGLATMLAVEDDGVPIHTWAAVFKSVGKLPDLIPYRKTWPEGTPDGVHPYYVPASFVGYLIEEYGITKVKRWYVNCTEAHMVFGKTFRRLERDWLAWLDEQAVEPAHRAHALKRFGLTPIPESYLKAEGTALFDGMTIEGLDAENSAAWKVQDGLLVGTNPKGWTLLDSEREFDVNVGVRVRFRLVEGNAIQVRLNRSDGSDNHANLATWTTLISDKRGGFQPGREGLKLTTGTWYHLVLVNKEGTGRLYLNDFLAAECKDQFELQKGTIGLGVESGTVEVEKFEAFEF